MYLLFIFVFIIYRSRLRIYYFKYFDFSDDIFYKQYKYRRNLQPKIVESVICAGIRISIPPNPDKPQSVCLPNPIFCQQSRHLQQEAPDYYGILGVTKNAELAEIKLAYFNMAKKFHPDTNKTLDARQVFALIAEAYDVLSDEARRSR